MNAGNVKKKLEMFHHTTDIISRYYLHYVASVKIILAFSSDTENLITRCQGFLQIM